MGKWLHNALKPTDTADSGPHADLVDLSRLIEGKLGGDERENLLRHLNHCGPCYEILQATMKDLQAEASAEPKPIAWWKTKSVYALAASILFLILVGGPLVYQFAIRHPLTATAELIMDQELKEILLEDDSPQWHSDKRIKRFLSVLDRKGYSLKPFDRVVLAKPYYQKKSILGPKEVLHIRIDDGVAYLEVKETK